MSCKLGWLGSNQAVRLDWENNGNVDVKNLRETSTEPGLVTEEALDTGDSTEYNIRKELTNCTYLEDSAVQLCGLKIYGELNIDTLSPESRVLVFDLHVKC